MDKGIVNFAPSILSADFARLGEQVAEAERAGADRIHIDVMDGHFVPNLSMGAPIVESLRRVTHLFLETHLSAGARGLRGAATEKRKASYDHEGHEDHEVYNKISDSFMSFALFGVNKNRKEKTCVWELPPITVDLV